MSKKNNALKNISLILQLGINVLVPTFLLLMLGLWIDQNLGTGYFGLIFMILGILGGGKSAYQLAMSSMEQEESTPPEEVVEEYLKNHEQEAVTKPKVIRRATYFSSDGEAREASKPESEVGRKK